MNINKLIKDQPKGLLEVYRKRASFEWKSLKLNMYGEEYLNFQVRAIFVQMCKKKKIVPEIFFS